MVQVRMKIGRWIRQDDDAGKLHVVSLASYINSIIMLASYLFFFTVELAHERGGRRSRYLITAHSRKGLS